MADQRRVTLWIFLLFQALYALTSSGNAFRVPDEFEVYDQVEHLVDAGDLSVPQAVSRGQFLGRIGLDQKPYAPYGPLTAVLALPHHLLARGVARIAGVPRGTISWTFVVSGLTMLATSTAAALAVAGFHRAAIVSGASPPAALLLSLMLGGASVLWAYGTSFYSEGMQAAMFIWAAVCLLERRIARASMLLAVAGLIEATSLVFVPGFLAAVMVDRSVPLERRVRATLALGAGAVVAVMIHLAWNSFRFGDVFEFGYNWAGAISVMPARPFLLSDLPRGLAILLLSPGKSVLLWAPVLVLSIARLRTCPRPLLIGVATSAACGLIFYGAYLFPEGGYAHGPRHLVPILPLLLLPAATQGPPWRRELITGCAAVGIAIALLAVSVSFLQDQAVGNDFRRLGYYERIDPPPGRAWYRYRLEYIPFIRTTTSGDWPASPRVGLGLDFFPLHLVRAKAAIPDARTIPIWLPLTLLLGWGALLTAAGTTLWRMSRLMAVRRARSGLPVLRKEGQSFTIPPRLIGLTLVGVSLVYLSLFVPRGWIPHDEGMIGESAERVLAGGVPHVDYEEPYTGGLAQLHAEVFRLAGVNLLYPRFVLFAGAALAQILVYLMLRRFLDPMGAAFGAWIALGWSFPNYFAAMPSWWVLICALACVWAFTRYVESGWLRYAAAAGLAAGVSIVIKQTGLYVLVALVMALLYGGGRQERETAVSGPARLLCASAALAALGLALAILRSRLASGELLYLLMPIAACSWLLLTANGRPSFTVRGMLLAPATAAAAAALPLACFIAPYLVNQHVGKLVNGLFILPQKRLQFASRPMPPAQWILAGIPLVVMLVPLPRLVRLLARRRRQVRTALWFLSLALPIVALYDVMSYRVIWNSTQAFAALLPIVICWLLFSGRIQDAKQRWIMFGFASMLAWASLVQFPFSAPIYFCYVTPIAVIAAAAAARHTAALRRPVVRASAALLLIFAVFSLNRGYAYNIGVQHEDTVYSVPLSLPRADFQVSALDAATYDRVVELVASHRGNGRLVAGPDCPEVYFLTGQFSSSGALFDFFEGDRSAGGLSDLSAWTNATVVVVNHRQSFSTALSPDLLASIRTAFPQMAPAGWFEVRWR